MSGINKKKAARLAMFLGTVGVSAALIGAGVGATGAYFSDTKAGTITGTIGSIQVSGGGDLQFTNMLPGEAQTVTSDYTNTGRNAQDVWVVFNQPDALHAINDLGTYGEVRVASNRIGEVFYSNNLNDNTTSCPPGSSSPTQGPCRQLPKMIKLADNLGLGAAGNFSFTFNYASKLTNGLNGSINPVNPAGSWNNYPLAAPTANGLPYQIVATQVGIAPGA